MSHLKERAEKNCLNCTAEVQGRYCQVCGQENIEPKESVWHLITHFFNDITHFDGKFFSTIRLLILKPGFLSKEYSLGKRASYLNPVRLYIFTSALFFLIVFFVKKQDWTGKAENGNSKHANKDLLSTDPSVKRDTVVRMVKDSSGKKLIPDTTFNITTSNAGNLLFLFNDVYDSRAAYDSAQLHAPIGKKDNWLMEKIHQRQYSLNDKYHHDKEAINEAYKHELLHNFPKVFFLSLPFFALFLKLLYVRRKQFYYVNHVIFSIHLYCSVFVFMLINMGIGALKDVFHLQLFSWLSILLFLFVLFFEYKSIRNFYQQGRIKSIVKMLLLNVFTSFIFIILLIALLIFSVYQI